MDASRDGYEPVSPPPLEVEDGQKDTNNDEENGPNPATADSNSESTRFLRRAVLWGSALGACHLVTLMALAVSIALLPKALILGEAVNFLLRLSGVFGIFFNSRCLIVLGGLWYTLTFIGYIMVFIDDNKNPAYDNLVFAVGYFFVAYSHYHLAWRFHQDRRGGSGPSPLYENSNMIDHRVD